VESLTRSVRLLTPSDTVSVPTVLLTDTAVFRNEGATFALPLISMDTEVTVTEAGRAEIHGQRGGLLVIYDPVQGTCRAEEIPTDDKKFQTTTGATRLRRLWFDGIVTGREARLELRISPLP
jgi:hypothetical protein